MLSISILGRGRHFFAAAASADGIEGMGGLDGVSVVKKVWDGKANLAEYKADGPVAGHLELMALRWLNPTTHEWNIDFATPNVGMFGAGAGGGQFKNGRVDFYDYELIDGRSVLVRFSMWSIDADVRNRNSLFGRWW